MEKLLVLTLPLMVLKTSDSRAVLPNDAKLRKEILDEAHKTQYTIHLGSTNMYQDLKKNYWWSDMKRDIAEYVTRCPSCQQVNAKHQRSARLLQPLNILKWKCIKLQ
jgi:homoserine kinase